MGDSITHFWEWRHPKLWEKFTKGRTVINSGFGGDGTQQVLWRLTHGELDGYTAKNVVLMIGTNNNSDRHTKPENVAKAIITIVELIKAKQPKAQIILHPIFPRGDSEKCVDFFGNSHAEARRRNDKTNAILKDYTAAHPEIVWLDINAKFLDKTGWVPRTIMGDAIHPTSKGYEIWMKELVPALKK